MHHMHNMKAMPISNPDYANETWRAKHGYKEEHTPDPPFKRCRDFKPINHGTFIGIPNFRHSEPFMFMKNIKDVLSEEHNIAISWGKTAAKGFVLGSIFGYTFFVGAPAG